MKVRDRTLNLVPLLTVILTAPIAAQREVGSPHYEKATRGTRWLESDRGTMIKMLVEEPNLGGSEVELGEITFPPRSGPARDTGHLHTAVEIFYILSGQFEHVVNGEAHVLSPGMVGIVRPGDRVVHRVLSEEPVRALVIWAPGGEAQRIARFFRERPLERH